MNFRWVNQGHGLKSFKLLLDRHPINLNMPYFLGKLICWTSSDGLRVSKFYVRTDFDPNFKKKGDIFSRGDINQGNMYLNFDFFLNQFMPDLRRVGLLFMLCAQMEAWGLTSYKVWSKVLLQVGSFYSASIFDLTWSTNLSFRTIECKPNIYYRFLLTRIWIKQLFLTIESRGFLNKNR